jgi:hypothetical protein
METFFRGDVLCGDILYVRRVYCIYKLTVSSIDIRTVFRLNCLTAHPSYEERAAVEESK